MHPTGPFFGGDELQYFDIMLAPFALRFGPVLKHFRGFQVCYSIRILYSTPPGTFNNGAVPSMVLRDSYASGDCRDVERWRHTYTTLFKIREWNECQRCGQSYQNDYVIFILFLKFLLNVGCMKAISTFTSLVCRIGSLAHLSSSNHRLLRSTSLSAPYCIGVKSIAASRTTACLFVSPYVTATGRHPFFCNFWIFADLCKKYYTSVITLNWNCSILVTCKQVILPFL